jgi:hypothetical protein
MALRERPTEIAPEAWGIVTKVVRGNIGDIDRNYAIHVGEECASFAAGQAFPDPKDGSIPVMSDATLCSDLSNEEFLQCCDDLAVGKVKGLIPWATIAKKILEALLPLLIK